jgi:hypothetical protein
VKTNNKHKLLTVSTVSLLNLTALPILGGILKSFKKFSPVFPFASHSILGKVWDGVKKKKYVTDTV